MAAATVVNQVIVLLTINILLSDVGGILPTITFPDISKEVADKCVVAFSPSLGTDNENLLECADEIGQVFRAAQARTGTPGVAAIEGGDELGAASDVQVTVGILEGQFDQDDQRVRIKGKKNQDYKSKDNVVILFPPVKKDRSCLLSPPKSFLIGEAYEGSISKIPLLEFINIKCNTFVDVSGELNIEGLHRQGILDTMFYMHYLPESKRMSEISFGKQKRESDFCSEMLYESSETEIKSNCQTEKLPSETIGSERNPSEDDIPRNMRNDYETLDHHASKYSKSHTPMAQCERIPVISKEDFSNYYLKRSRPVVIPNGARHWPAFTKWTMEYLRELYGKKSVHIKLAPDGVFEGVEPASLWEDYNQLSVPEEVSSQLLYPDLVVVRPATQNVKFSEFLDMVQNASKSETSKSDGQKARVSAYLEYSSIPSHFPELEDDVEEPDFIQGVLDRRHLNIWLSDGNTLGKLHFDPFDNFLCQLRGRKELTLFEPHNNNQLYEAHIPEALLGFDPASQRFRRKKLMDSTSMVMSPVDIQDPDYQRFPEFGKARPLNCTLTEGDILFMPAFWWHEVQSYPNDIEGRNLAVNFWYEPFFTKEFPCAECKLDVNPHYRHLLHHQNELYQEDHFIED